MTEKGLKPVRPSTEAMRQCLRCEKTFKSESSANRICKGCKNDRKTDYSPRIYSADLPP